jgi:uncharacterized protein (DUF2235 family)
MKNIVLCLDGTSNQFAWNRTNVVKLVSLLVQDPARQAVYYHPGVGTMPPPGALTWLAKKVTLILGLAFGYGLKNDIRDAYVFLMNSYQPGDRVYIFGFSRGAYTARALASLLKMYGLIARGNEGLVPYAVRLLIRKGKGKAGADAYFRTAEAFRETYSSVACDPHFVGVWDTVSSVGWVDNQLSLPFTAENDAIAIGRHAIAIDERRAFFRTNLWRGRDGEPPAGPKDLKQVWFAGVHCDVGGGYPEDRSHLSAIALLWMVREAEVAGLLIDPQRRAFFLPRYAQPDPNAPLNVSLTWCWWPCEFVLKRHWNWAKHRWGRRMNLGRRRTIPSGSMIHRSAWDRGEAYRTRAGIPADAVVVD